MSKDPDKKTYASYELPTVAAAIDGLLRLESKAQATAFLRNLADHHITAREQLPSAAAGESLTLWVRGYDVSAEQSAEGAIGNMVALAVRAVGTRWSIASTKLLLPASQHPQRAYVTRGKHPNWAYPLLKSIKNGKVYPTAEAAAADLAALHEAFPQASIPTRERLYLMVFSRAKGEKGSPVKKVILETALHEAGGFIITIRDNEGRKNRAAKKPEKQAPAQKSATEDAKGKFTAREQLKRTRKRK
jgi:hypothetical protein